MRGTHFLILLMPLLGTPLLAHAASNCQALAKDSEAYLRASDAVRKLPEFQAWSASHSFPVAFGTAVDKQELIQGHCYWSVTVYADRPERLEFWNSFFVSLPGNRVVFIQDPRSGGPLALSIWREQSSEASKTK